jgi:hypothetical protein
MPNQGNLFLLTPVSTTALVRTWPTILRRRRHWLLTCAISLSVQLPRMLHRPGSPPPLHLPPAVDVSIPEQQPLIEEKRKSNPGLPCPDSRSLMQPTLAPTSTAPSLWGKPCCCLHSVRYVCKRRRLVVQSTASSVVAPEVKEEKKAEVISCLLQLCILHICHRSYRLSLLLSASQD